MAAERLERRESLTPDQVQQVRRLANLATEADGVRPMSEHVTLHLGTQPSADETTAEHPAPEHLLLWHDSELAGYAQLTPDNGTGPASVELAVAPNDHAATHSESLVERAIADSPHGVRLWAHGENSGTARVATRMGFTVGRVLLQLRRSLYAALPSPQWPPGVDVRTFQVGQDEAAWLTVNNRAFAQHPDQSDWTMDDIRMREAEPWFDPDGFFLAERAGRIVGFHWTKIHGATHRDGPGSDHDHEPMGEVYVVGVDPDLQGQHLGGALTLVGLAYLRRRGLPQVMLYVDESNHAAMATYTKLGFAHWDTDVCYVRS